jgi:hypothetical protein
MSPNPGVQFSRYCKLLVSTDAGQVVDLSEFRIVFSIKRSNSQTPNAADIRIYNLAPDTALSLANTTVFTTVQLQAGYVGNTGTIFQGDIKQVIVGRESATDTFIEIIAGDGHLAYNYAVISQPLPANTTSQADIAACIKSLSDYGVMASGNVTVTQARARYRAKVLFGQTKKCLRDVTQTTGSPWSIQNEKLVFVPTKSFLPGEVIIINSETGMVGSPQQTLEGINFKCLLNPNLQISRKVQLNQNSIQRLAINLSAPGTAASIPAPINTDGVYYVSVAEHVGDTRGVEWYTNVITLFIDPSLPMQNSIPVTYEQ